MELIGANIEEAIGAQSKADFLSKLSIACKEARETCYWLKLLQLGGYVLEQMAHSLIEDAQELCRIIGRIQVTTKTKYINLLSITNYEWVNSLSK